MTFKLYDFSLKYLFFILICLFNSNINCQKDNSTSKGYIYGSWGYNRNFYLNSDIHFYTSSYDFILSDVKASDRPQEFTIDNYFNPKNISIPQYNFRLGYYLTDRIHISVGMDHMKYVVDQNQTVTINGFINSTSNTNFNGIYSNQSLDIKKGFLEFEHTNGLNLVTIQGDYALPLIPFHKNLFELRYNMGIGGIWVGTKSDVRIIDEGIDNDHHLAGYSVCIQTGPRLEYKKLFFIDIQARLGHMYLHDIFIENELAPKRASQAITYFNYSASLGVMFSISKKARKN